MFGKRRPDAAQLAALEQVRQWTRQRFTLANNAAVLVTELSCDVSGCPPLETVVAFWSEPAQRHHFKVFKPVVEVLPDDLPFAWMKNALITAPGFDCACC